MAGPVDGLRSAGFSDDEITKWSTEKRDALSGAGFKENEIDGYFAGGVTAPEGVPDAVVKRVANNTLMSDIGDFAKQGLDTILKNEPDHDVASAVEQYALKHGMSPAQAKQQREVIEGRMRRGNILTLAGPMELAASPILGAFRQFISRPLEESSGVPKEVTEGFSMVAAAVFGIGRSILKKPTGEPIGPLPESQDFVDAAHVVGGDARMPVQEKLLKVYEESGVLPAEMAADAQRDPTIAQKLLSSDPQDMPIKSSSVSKEPTVPDGYVRFYHGWKDGGDPANRGGTAWATTDRQYATDFRRGSDPNNVSYVDIPKGDAVEVAARAWDQLDEMGGTNMVGRYNHAELPPEWASQMKAFGDGSSGGKPPKPPKPPEPGSFEEAQKKVLDKISVGDGEKGKMTWSKLYTDTIDELHPLKAVSEDAYEMARLTRGNFGKAEHFIEHGTFEFDSLKDTGKPLREIMEPVSKDLDGFRAYLASKRALEIEATERKSGIDVDAAKRVVDEGAGKFDKTAQEMVGYQNRLLQYLKDSGVLSDKAFDAMVEANKSYVPFYRVFFPEKSGPSSKGFGPGNPIKALKGSDRGIVDPLESVIKNTYAYVSIAERNAVGIKLIDALKEQGFKEAKKSPKFEGAEGELVDYLKQNGVTDAEALIDFVKASAAPDGEVISAWRGGKRESVEVNDPELVKAFNGMDAQSVGLLTRIFAVPARTLRAGAVLTPDFMARNIIRDFQTAMVNSKGLFSPIDTAKGMVGVIRKDADFMNWLKAGGANSTMVALDRRYLQESLSSLTKETGLGDRAWNVLTNPLAPLRMMSELMENATRLGEFKKVAGGTTDKATMQEGAFASREVTLDFARMGARMRAYNMVTAFANAQIQGMDRIVRAFADRPVNTTLKIAGGITMPSVLLWWANHGDQRYEELPSWQKDLFWIVLTDKWEPISDADAANKPDHLVRRDGGKTEFNNGHIWRIPKPFELGVVFGSGVERILDRTVGNDPEAFEGFSKSVVNVLTPNFIPTGVQPVFEQWANRSTFTDRTLIPADLEKQLPEYQYTPYTTELSKALGQIISAFPGMRDAATDPGAVAGPAARALTTPILIENYVRSWTGGLGMYAINAADSALRQAGVLPDPIKPTPTLADIPFVKAFAVRYPSATTESIQSFYDDYAQNKRFYDTYMAKAKEGDEEAMQKIAAAGGPMMFVQLDEIKQTLSEHSKLVRDVYKNPDMPAEEKRQLIDSLYYSMIQIGQAGREMMRQAKSLDELKPIP